MRVKSRIDVMRTEYNTDDAEEPKEIATLYDVFYFENGKKGDTEYFMMIIRRKSRIVFKQGFGMYFYGAMQQYHRKIRERAQDINPIAKSVQEFERKWELVNIEP